MPVSTGKLLPRAYADECRRMLTGKLLPRAYADECRRMLTGKLLPMAHATRKMLALLALLLGDSVGGLMAQVC